MQSRQQRKDTKTPHLTRELRLSYNNRMGSENHPPGGEDSNLVYPLNGYWKWIMSKTVKVPNYTVEQTAELKAAYVANPTKDTVSAFAVKFGKSVRSIVAKLSKENVYHKAEYVSKTGEKPVKKDTHADAIGKILGMSENDTESLTKANKVALVTIFKALANSKPLENGEGPEDTLPE